MASQRFNPQNFVIGVIKFVCGVAIALFVIGLAGAATARYFLTQLSTLPERPVYENDASAKQTTSTPAEATTPKQPAADGNEQAQTPPPEQTPQPEASDANVLFKATVTYSAGLLIRTNAESGAATIDGIDYNETVEVLEESGKWYRIRTSSGVEGWIKGKDNTKRL